MSYIHPDDVDHSTGTLENAIARHEAFLLQRSENEIAHIEYLEEAEICRNCRYWTRLTSGYMKDDGEYLFGSCYRIGMDINWCTSKTDARDRQFGRQDKTDNVLLESGHPVRDERDAAYMYPGEEFGCRHFERKPIPLTAEELAQCPF